MKEVVGETEEEGGRRKEERGRSKEEGGRRNEEGCIKKGEPKYDAHSMCTDTRSASISEAPPLGSHLSTICECSHDVLHISSDVCVEHILCEL